MSCCFFIKSLISGGGSRQSSTHLRAAPTAPRNPPTHNNATDVAPGEGQIPTSVLKERNWDILTYPHLFSDGKNGMNADGRKVRLTNQQYENLATLSKQYSS